MKATCELRRQIARMRVSDSELFALQTAVNVIELANLPDYVCVMSKLRRHYNEWRDDRAEQRQVCIEFIEKYYRVAE